MFSILRRHCRPVDGLRLWSALVSLHAMTCMLAPPLKFWKINELLVFHECACDGISVGLEVLLKYDKLLKYGHLHL